MSTRWYVVFTKPRLEALAQEHLMNQGMDAWYPRARVVKRRATGREEVVESMFPRYIFVELTQGQHHFAKIRSTRGCIDLVRFGFEYKPVPVGFVEALRSQCDEEGLVPLESKTVKLQAGSKVMLLDGAMAGLVGELRSYKAADRVIVLMNLMGSVAQVEVPVDNIELA